LKSDVFSAHPGTSRLNLQSIQAKNVLLALTVEIIPSKCSSDHFFSGHWLFRMALLSSFGKQITFG